MHNLKFNFYLLGQKGYQVLKDVFESFSASIFNTVVIGTDKNIDNDFSNEMKIFCELNKISFIFRNDVLRNSEIYSGYKFAIGWRWMISNPMNLIVIHDSLLPKYRGFSPLVNSLINGEEYIGVTGLLANDTYDSGDVIYQEKLKIKYPIKIQQAIEKIAPLYSRCVLKIIQNLLNDNIKRIPQNHSEATYSVWRDEEDYFINWAYDATKIIRTINALGFPYSGAKTIVKNKVIIIHDAIEVEDIEIEARNEHIGKVIRFENNHPLVICGKGLIKIILMTYNNQLFQLETFRTRFKNLNDYPI